MSFANITLPRIAAGCIFLARARGRASHGLSPAGPTTLGAPKRAKSPRRTTICLWISHYTRIDSAFSDTLLGRCTLNDLCTRPEHLSSLIGYGLESSECDADVRGAYRGIAALRNQLLHKGALAYEWTSDARQLRVSIETPQHGWDHLKLSLDLIDSVGALVAAKGHASGLRGMHRCEWNRRRGQPRTL